MQLDFDTSRMLQVLFSLGPSSRKGILVRQTGLFSFSTLNGQTEFTNTFPDFLNPGTTITMTQKTSGTQRTYSANFTGTVGTHNVQPPPIGANGSMSTHLGGSMVVPYTSMP